MDPPSVERPLITLSVQVLSPRRLIREVPLDRLIFEGIT